MLKEFIFIYNLIDLIVSGPMSKTWKQFFSGFFFASILIPLDFAFIFWSNWQKRVLLFTLNL